MKRRIEKHTQTPRMDNVWEVLGAAKDAGDQLAISACRRLIEADRRGWKRHHSPADYRMVLDLLAA